MSRVIVIGAGMAGLTAAARLAVKGHSVTVFEQAPMAGGKVGRYERDGFVFDTGPSLLTLPQVYRDFFNKTGQPIESALDIVELEPAYTYTWADATRVVMPGADTSRCADALGDALGAEAADDWRSLMKRAARMWELTRQDFLESPLNGVGSLAKLAADPRNIAAIAPLSTLRQLGQRMLTDHRLVTLLDRYATYTGSDPRRAPAALATIPYVEQTFGAHHIAGGIHALADAVFQRCIERGVQFKFDTAVSSITCTHNTVTGITTADGIHHRADFVVANADATAVYEQLLPEQYKTPRSLSQRPQSLSGFCMYVAVREKTPGIAHHNVWFCDDYDDEFNSVFATRRRAARPIPEPTVYACVPQDSAMAPAGHEAWFILVNAAPQGNGHAQVDWTAPGLAEGYARNVLETLRGRGVDLSDRLLWAKIRTPADIENETFSPGGSIYGTASHGPRSSFTRPRNQSPIPGLYLVGGSSHPGGGLPLVGMSGAIAAELIGRAQSAPSTPSER